MNHLSFFFLTVALSFALLAVYEKHLLKPFPINLLKKILSHRRRDGTPAWFYFDMIIARCLNNTTDPDEIHWLYEQTEEHTYLRSLATEKRGAIAVSLMCGAKSSSQALTAAWIAMPYSLEQDMAFEIWKMHLRSERAGYSSPPPSPKT